MNPFTPKGDSWPQATWSWGFPALGKMRTGHSPLPATLSRCRLTHSHPLDCSSSPRPESRVSCHWPGGPAAGQPPFPPRGLFLDLSLCSGAAYPTRNTVLLFLPPMTGRLSGFREELKVSDHLGPSFHLIGEDEAEEVCPRAPRELGTEGRPFHDPPRPRSIPPSSLSLGPSSPPPSPVWRLPP